jgi:hypothetical protein
VVGNVIQLEDLQGLRVALLAPECSEAYRQWCDFLPDLGRSEVADESLVEQLNVWDPDPDSLREAVQAAPQDGGQALIGWLYQFRTLSPDLTVGGSGDMSESPRDEAKWPQQLGPWEGMPGWWIALEPVDGEWYALESVARPDGSETSWQLSSAVLASSGDPVGLEGQTVQSWYAQPPQQVSEVEGWWAVKDADDVWWAIQSQECPDAGAQGWVLFEQAFPPQQAGPEVEQPVEPETPDQEHVEEPAPQEPAESTSPYTRRAYTDPIYEGKRSEVAVALDLDNYHDLDDDGKIAKLFQRFKDRPFQYTMRAGGFDRYAGGNGDCKTLMGAFITVARQEFGIEVKEGKMQKPFLVAFTPTIDPEATGNCDNGNKWFFQNHYWADYGGQAYDLLFGTLGVELGDPTRDTGTLETTDGEATDRQYWTTEAGVLVWENNPEGEPAERYRSDETPDRSELREAGYQVSLVVHGRWYLQAHGEDAFFAWMSGLQPAQQARLRSDDELAAVANRLTRRALGLDRGGEPDRDPNVVLAERIDGQARAIMEAVAGLDAEEPDPTTVGDLETAMESVMGDIDAYQRAVADGPSQSLYQAGAAAAQALAIYMESPDRESRAALGEAVGLLGEWAAQVQPR